MKRYLKITEGSDCDLIAATIDAVLDGAVTIDKIIVLSHMLRVTARDIEAYKQNIIVLENTFNDLTFDSSTEVYKHVLIGEARERIKDKVKEGIKDSKYELSCLYMLQDEIQQILKDIKNGE